jgi:hypothetical protein
MRTNIDALSRIRTHDPSNQPAKTYASDCTATVTSLFITYKGKFTADKVYNLKEKIIYW